MKRLNHVHIHKRSKDWLSVPHITSPRSSSLCLHLPQWDFILIRDNIHLLTAHNKKKESVPPLAPIVTNKSVKTSVPSLSFFPLLTIVFFGLPLSNLQPVSFICCLSPGISGKISYLELATFQVIYNHYQRSKMAKEIKKNNCMKKHESYLLLSASY